MDTGQWRRPDEASAHDIDDGLAPRPNRLATSARQWWRYVTVNGRRSAAIGVAFTFVLLLASQWIPWAKVQPQTGSVTDASGSGAVGTLDLVGGAYKVGIDDASTTLTLSYYLIWVIALALAGATVFASRRTRQPLFGAAIGAIVVQFVAIVPLLRHPKGLIVNSISDIAAGSNATELVVTREPGIFCAVAALLVLAAAMVLAVDGKVLPSLSDEPGAQPDVGTPEPARDVPAIEVEVLPAQDVAADGRDALASASDSGTAPQVYPDVVAFTVESVEGMPERPDAIPTSPAKTDHSAYARPLGNEQYRR
jgi:hypothetical protein